MKRTKTGIVLLAVALLMGLTVYPQTGRVRPRAMATWAGKYPDEKFFNQPLIRRPLRRILSKEDYESIGDYFLMIPIKRVGDYLVTWAQVKYSDPMRSLSVAFSLKDGAVYAVFWEGEQHREFSTEHNQFNLPEAVLTEMGLDAAKRQAQFPRSSRRQMNPHPPPSSLTASISSLRPFFKGR